MAETSKLLALPIPRRDLRFMALQSPYDVNGSRFGQSDPASLLPRFIQIEVKFSLNEAQAAKRAVTSRPPRDAERANVSVPPASSTMSRAIESPSPCPGTDSSARLPRLPRPASASGGQPGPSSATTTLTPLSSRMSIVTRLFAHLQALSARLPISS